MTNPFDDQDGRYVVLRNEYGQCSMWPTFAAVPAGWAIVHGADDRAGCVDYLDSPEWSMSNSRVASEEPVR